MDIEVNEESKNHINNDFEQVETKEKTNEDNIIILKEEKDTNFFVQKNVNEIDKDDKYLLLVLNIIDYYPKNILDFCMIYCPECNERCKFFFLLIKLNKIMIYLKGKKRN